MTSKIKVDNITDQNDNNIINESGDVITVGAAGDTVAVAGNIVKSNAYQASDGGNIVNQSGTTITIGASGDTVSLASGASQSGFGRSGSVDWQTGSLKTSTFTAASGEGYFVNASGSITMNLPAGTAGAIVAVSDYARNFATHNLIILPNGSQKIGGVAAQATLNVNGQAATFVYVDDTKGWVNVQNAEDTEIGAAFISATGGSVAESGDCKIHTFTSPGTFNVSSISSTPSQNAVAYLVIAGGGGGGGGDAPDASSGAGAGGFREGRNNPITPYTASPLVTCGHTVSVQAYPITVGAGGSAGSTGSPGNQGNKGSDSTFSSFTSGGGGAGHGQNNGNTTPGQGGSGAGASGGSPRSGMAGNTPPVSPPQGNAGGASGPGGIGAAGGGGGAGAPGNNSGGDSGPGGCGATTSISGSPVVRAGGGAAGGAPPRGTGPGNPGPGGGGAHGNAGTANTGGGGGGGTNAAGGAGGSGIVIIRYKFQ